ncbi:uncharacterized protein LY89DRAFT_682188 [Mollisia scopiformis]|uniref:Secreted protein n=1 Tax=Mollisia scopiformis TaxID=149040 RepID=A0A194XJX6_MOLSC|nr:uncharacterized protein LY89DRAFT_682188 [Mollisia scopiformis]KUJ20453.1 hypothetical protein LY89DRAFT_682188 [Mollisia scopiformis]
MPCPMFSLLLLCLRGKSGPWPWESRDIFFLPFRKTPGPLKPTDAQQSTHTQSRNDPMQGHTTESDVDLPNTVARGWASSPGKETFIIVAHRRTRMKTIDPGRISPSS